MHQIYEFPAFTAFIKQALVEESFYRYADPLANVIVNAAEEGGGFPWHFDTNNYTGTTVIQNSKAGGEFEYAPALRTPTDENYDEVETVLGEPARGSKRWISSRATYRSSRAAIRCTESPRCRATACGWSRSFPLSNTPTWSPRQNAAGSYTARFCRSIWNRRACAWMRWSTEVFRAKAVGGLTGGAAAHISRPHGATGE